MTRPGDDALQRRFGTNDPHLDIPADAPDLHRQLAMRGVVRSFTPEPVPYELLHRLCAIALCSPTKSDLQQRDIPFFLQDFCDRYEGRYHDVQLPLPIRLV